MSDKNFDPGMKDTCELKEAWADGKKLYYVEDIPGLLEQVTCLNKQLAKANERVSELEQELLHHKNVNRDIHLKNSGIATLVSELTGNSVVLPKMKTRGEIKSALKKFAIEQQIEGLKDYQALCGFADCRKSIDARIAQLEEQLRKEQASEQ